MASWHGPAPLSTEGLALARANERLTASRERLAYANETLVLAESLWGLLWPWRWLRWFRVYREVGRRNAHLRAWRVADDERWPR